METNINSLTAGQRKELRRVVEEQFFRYRYFKTAPIERIEAAITQSYEERFHGATGTTSDPTAKAAIKNVGAEAFRRAFCEKIERIVDRLPVKEMKLIKLRYMAKVDVIADSQLYRTLGVTSQTFRTRRDTAFYRLADVLQLDWDTGARVAEQDKPSIM